MDLNNVRAEIDRIDGELIRLLAERQRWVETAGRLKPRNDAAAVAAPERVAHVLATRRAQAEAAGLSPQVASAVWQAMITAFIELEQETNRQPTTDHPQSERLPESGNTA